MVTVRSLFRIGSVSLVTWLVNLWISVKSFSLLYLRNYVEWHREMTRKSEAVMESGEFNDLLLTNYCYKCVCAEFYERHFVQSRGTVNILHYSKIFVIVVKINTRAHTVCLIFVLIFLYFGLRLIKRKLRKYTKAV